MTKRLYVLFIAMTFAIMANAQQNAPGKRFSPEQFDAELQSFIAKEASLTPQETTSFFIVYKEMQKKQRALFVRQRQLSRVKPADEQGCMKAIQERDQIEVELKRIQEQYHNKFFEILPASKVYDVIKAEDKFHRSKLKQWSHGPKPDGR